MKAALISAFCFLNFCFVLAGSPRVNDTTGNLLYPTNFWDEPGNKANLQRVAGGSATVKGFSGTVTNLTETIVTTVGPNLLPSGSQYGGTSCGLTGVALPSLQANTSYRLILGPNEPVACGFLLLDGNCINQVGPLSATNVLNFSSVQNPYTIGCPSGNPSGLVTFTVQQITTNVVQSFNVTTYSNGVAQTNNGMVAYNPPAPAAGVQYGGPMMFDYYMGCTNILSDGMGDVLIQAGGCIYVNYSDTQGFAYRDNDSPMTTIGSGSIVCTYGPGYQGSLTDNQGSQGPSTGAILVANGDGSWTWGGSGGASFYAPGCSSINNNEYGSYSVFSPNCENITDYAGFCFFGPDCSTITDDSGYSLFGSGCNNITDYGGHSAFGPGCNNITDIGSFSLFGPGCANITAYGVGSFFGADCTSVLDGTGGSCYGPSCSSIANTSGEGSWFGPYCSGINNAAQYAFFGPGCYSLTAENNAAFFAGSNSGDSDYGANCFYGPGCSGISSSSAYSAYFAVNGGTIENCTGVLVVGDNATAVRLANETSLIVAGSYQIGVGTNNVRLTTDGSSIIPTVPVALTNGIVTMEGTTFYPHTVAGALVWTTNPAHD